MAQLEDSIDTVLADLRQDTAHALTMINICIQLRRNSAHLLQLLASMLDELRDHIEQALPVLPSQEGDDYV